ncbi:small G protein signaling modulator 1-like isoform X2 [Corticium candelabrum]|uniref:small G protein signaling modulator 1-like isoform X2 n=1 Tax=Corticium candelabrum TaxID=121492 RepID=UPI002E25D0B5|nr:small G protein signaling modulator 1-like isoform X2 [Corticium candelabrum]
MSRWRVERERLLSGVKRAVKQLMEEVVTRKFVHEEGGIVLTLCVEIEACFAHCVRSRLFVSSSTFELVLGRLAHFCAPAAELYRVCNEIMTVQQTNSSAQTVKISRSATGVYEKTEDFKKRLHQFKSRYLAQHRKLRCNTTALRVLWVRIALVEKLLGELVDVILKNVNHFYEEGALLAHAVDGPIFANLLAGPNVLDFSKIKTSEHLRSDPPAPELIDKQRLFGACHKDSVLSLLDLPALETLPSPHTYCETTACTQVKEHIEMLHQTSTSTLLFAKNNVIVHKDSKSSDGIPGYLSLHQFNDQVILKWTPNFLVSPQRDQQLENGICDGIDLVVSLDIRKIVSIHCHKQADDESEQTQLIAQDGRQFPPLVFPSGGSLTSFLVSLETGLLPHGRLSPPLWARKSKQDSIFPTRRKNQRQGKIALQPIDYVVPDDPFQEARQASNHYVFHVIHGVETGVKAGLMDSYKLISDRRAVKPVCSNELSMGGDLNNAYGMLAEAIGESDDMECEKNIVSSSERSSINDSEARVQSACEQVIHQIKSRAFYGWLSHVRHMSYLRRHLLGFVSNKIVPIDRPCDASVGVTEELWETVLSRGNVCDKKELLRLVYYGGVHSHIRAKVWPYLIGHYEFGLRPTECALLDADVRAKYNAKIDEWMGVEQEVKRQSRQEKRLQQQTADEVDGYLTLSNYASCSNDDSPAVDLRDFPDGSSRETSLSPVCTAVAGGKLPVANDLEEVDGLFETVDGDSGCEDLEADSSRRLLQDELIQLLKINIERIDKDVVRCDRNYSYFENAENLVKLRNVLMTYVWDGRLNPGYIQGMCDIVAPLFVVLDDEVMVWNCFQILLTKLGGNFNAGEQNQMDLNFSNLRALLRVMDPDLHELLQDQDCTHLYFTHRWFLVDFKREFGYDGIFYVWEMIWAAGHCSSQFFRIFIAFALLQQYKHVLLHNEMGFTDITKFFNEMAEHHDVAVVMDRARQLVADLHRELYCGISNPQVT